MKYVQKEFYYCCSLSEGGGIDLIHLIRKAFSVLNRLLLLRHHHHHQQQQQQLDGQESDGNSMSVAPSGVAVAVGVSPVEHCLSAQPADLSQRHVVATIAQYMYHRHDPRLPRLATLLLKRLGERWMDGGRVCVCVCVWL